MIKNILAVILIVTILASLGFVLWGAHPLGPMPDALSALSSSSLVEVVRSNGYQFTPVLEVTHNTGLIFYPGGRVDVRSYAPLLVKIAEAGYPVFLVSMPLSLAVLDPNAADRIIQDHPEVENWVIGGHSLGGAMAAAYAYEQPEKISGLFLLGAYPVQGNDFRDSEINVISLYGTEDGLVTPADIEASRPLLPNDTIWLEIQGGNHAQMGWYGNQPGDGSATIEREQQQSLIRKGLINFLENIGEQ